MSTLVALSAWTLVLAVGPARAQDIEPRAYSNAPVGVNFLVTGYAYTNGGLAFDSASPLSDPRLTTSSAVLGYARVLEFRGQSARVDVLVPYSWLDGSALYNGEPVRREITGLMDPRFRCSLNLLGAPALSLKEFAGYRQDLIVAASLQVTVPVGQYDESRLVNLGTHRWTIKPEVGASKALGRWTLEAAASANLFTDNPEFYPGTTTRSQDPLYSLQGHVIYGFRSGLWGALDANYFTGGEVSIDGAPGTSRQENWRLGGTMTFPISRRHSLRLYASSGVSARTGNSFDMLGVAWQQRWGGGL